MFTETHFLDALVIRCNDDLEIATAWCIFEGIRHKLPQLVNYKNQSHLSALKLISRLSSYDWNQAEKYKGFGLNFIDKSYAEEICLIDRIFAF